jgi:adenosine deaminase
MATKSKESEAAITMTTDATSDKYMIQYIQDLPKVELHAHLNGCIREETLFELAKERNVTLSEHHFSPQPHTGDDHSMYNVRPRSLQDCFDMFAEIPKCVDDLASLTRITTEALEDFAQHHVVYLELRSTPKQLLLAFGCEKTASKRMYCETVLDAIKKYEMKEEWRYKREVSDGVSSPRMPLVCRFLVAVDRSQSAADAIEHVQLALSLQEDFKKYVVGVDLGGNPTKVSYLTCRTNCLLKGRLSRADRFAFLLLAIQNNFKDFKQAFELARSGGLKVTLHCGKPISAHRREL